LEVLHNLDTCVVSRTVGHTNFTVGEVFYIIAHMHVCACSGSYNSLLFACLLDLGRKCYPHIHIYLSANILTNLILWFKLQKKDGKQSMIYETILQSEPKLASYMMKHRHFKVSPLFVSGTCQTHHIHDTCLACIKRIKKHLEF